MSQRALGLALTLALAACGEPAEPTHPTSGTSAPVADRSEAPKAAAPSAAGRVDSALDARAIRLVRSEWERILAKLEPEMTSWGLAVDAVMQREKPPFSVSMEPCASKLAALERSYGDVRDFALHGNPQRLASHADCRVVFLGGGMKLEIEFILDADATELLFAWRVPEG